jgi:hypothetical protein
MALAACAERGIALQPACQEITQIADGEQTRIGIGLAVDIEVQPIVAS